MEVDLHETDAAVELSAQRPARAAVVARVRVVRRGEEGLVVRDSVLALPFGLGGVFTDRVFGSGVGRVLPSRVAHVLLPGVCVGGVFGSGVGRVLLPGVCVGGVATPRLARTAVARIGVCRDGVATPGIGRVRVARAGVGHDRVRPHRVGRCPITRIEIRRDGVTVRAAAVRRIPADILRPHGIAPTVGRSVSRRRAAVTDSPQQHTVIVAARHDSDEQQRAPRSQAVTTK